MRSRGARMHYGLQLRRDYLYHRPGQRPSADVPHRLSTHAPERPTARERSSDNDADGDGVCDGDEVTGCTRYKRLQLRRHAHHRHRQRSVRIRNRVRKLLGSLGRHRHPSWNTTTDGDGVCDADEVTGLHEPRGLQLRRPRSTTDTDNYPLRVQGRRLRHLLWRDRRQRHGGGQRRRRRWRLRRQRNHGLHRTPLACNYDATHHHRHRQHAVRLQGRRLRHLLWGNRRQQERSWTTTPTAMASATTTRSRDAPTPRPATTTPPPTTDTDDTLCVFKVDACDTCSGETDGTGSVVDNDDDDDGVCDDDEVTGCTNPTACNYNANPTTNTDNTLCAFKVDACDTCSGETDGSGTVVDNDADNDGVCNDDEITGCTDSTACNYDATSTTNTDNTLCVFKVDACDTCSGETDGTGTVVDNDADNDGVCNDDEVTGCTDSAACNYDATSTTDTDNYALRLQGRCLRHLLGRDRRHGHGGRQRRRRRWGLRRQRRGHRLHQPRGLQLRRQPAPPDTDNSAVRIQRSTPATPAPEKPTAAARWSTTTPTTTGSAMAMKSQAAPNSTACNYDATSTTDTDNTLCVFKVDACDTCSGETDGTGTRCRRQRCRQRRGLRWTMRSRAALNSAACNYDATQPPPTPTTRSASSRSTPATPARARPTARARW